MGFSSLTACHETSSSPKKLLLSVTTLVVHIAKRASQVSKRLKPPQKHRYCSSSSSSRRSSSWMSETKSTLSTPFTRPKKLLKNISHKAMKLVHKNKEDGDVEENDFGDGGVWQKAILMGDKCQPLDFSGVIYYDENGNKLDPIAMGQSNAMPGYLARQK